MIKKEKDMQGKSLFAVLLVMGCLLSGCSPRLIDFTIISTKNVDLAKSDKFKRSKDRIEGKDIIPTILFIPFGVSNLKEAVDRAIEKVPGAVALVDGVVYVRNWYFLVFGQSGYMVEGTPLIDTSVLETTTAVTTTTTTTIAKP